FEDLVDYVNNFTIDDENATAVTRKLKQIIKYDEDREISPYLDVYKTGNFIGTPTATFPRETDHNLVIAMSLDPFDSYPFGWAICLYTSDGKTIQRFQKAESIPKFRDKPLSAFIWLMKKFVKFLKETFQYLSDEESRA
ncbi:14837_t:CDS:2, partial [Dentiscutata heterogama]